MGKKKHEEHENHERWLVSYADFITMLFAFFTMMYANAPKDNQKIKEIIEGIKEAFGGGARVDIVELLDIMNLATENPVEAPVEMQKVHINPEPVVELEVPPDPSIDKGSLTDHVVQIGEVEQDMNLLMPEKLLFVPGSTELPVAAFDWLNTIAEAVKGQPAEVQVIGHADSTPIPAGGHFKDNWDLAGARAAEVVRYLHSKGISTERLTLGGTVLTGSDPEQRSVVIRVHIQDPAAAAEVQHELWSRGIGQNTNPFR